jgi:hypothetical protein
MAVWPLGESRNNIGVAPGHHTYSVRFMQLQMPTKSQRQSSGAGVSAAVAARRPAMSQAARIRSPQRAAARSSSSGDSESLARERRPFKLPRYVQVQQVKQTVVQMDLPPNITLKQDMPLATALLWTETAPPPMRRRFVAPPMRRAVPKIVESLPTAPTLTVPNREVYPDQLSIAAVITPNMPHLVHLPSVASPVSRTGQQPAKEIPQVGLANSAQPNEANVISLPEDPLRSSSLLVLPPVNQIAASDAGNAGSPLGHGTGTGANGHESDSSGPVASGGAGSASAGASGDGSSGASPGVNGAGAAERAGNGSGSGGVTIASGSAGNGKASAGRGHWTASGSTGSVENSMAGFTRIDLPKDGKFGVVVLGSAAAEVYPESAGALSGKIVYTVYLKVGLRKSWILQYCLPKSEDRSADVGRSAVPVEAPWPFLIMRPDQWSAEDPDYIIVHGTLNSAGKFDQLAMVFPEELEKKVLILDSLKLWAFRPASRDKVPVAIEVLLIIPREAE